MPRRKAPARKAARKRKAPRKPRKARKTAGGGYVPGKLLAKLTIGRMIKALKAHWKK